MIAFDFDYYKPSTLSEAVDTFQLAHNAGRQAIFYAGGTEFITFARTNKKRADVVIDIKGIPECMMLEVTDEQLIIGATVSLTTIVESNLFPLLGETVQRIADHTSRNKITIGGNLNSHFIYREGILPFLLVNARGMIAGKGKERILPIEQILNEGLKEGELLVQIHVDQPYVKLPFSTIKRTRMSKVGYPIVTVAALTKNKRIRVAFSGVCEFPFRSVEIEEILNNLSISKEERVNQVIDHLPGPVVQDIHASAVYRLFVVKNVLTDTLNAMEGNK
ncbi:FAD binding domain-containing protein [Sporosarcina beigongshangi]|uniref:FAD binding domain-containing protein n=1 Tax=Sporosarcina beigongshangi TaxID=2782538 RepID=UPI0019394231|nr:FAD binding domain-containing protein [Sporosarcina beigongshangi]